MEMSFETCLAFTRGEEGGYVADPRDSGNWTSGQTGQGVLVGSNMGVGAPALLDWMGPGASVTAEQMRSLPLSTYEAIARSKYWTPLGCAAMPSGLDLMAFDFGWNRGPGTSLALFARCIALETHRDALDEETPVTTALDALPPRTLLNRIAASRIKLLQREMGVRIDGIVGPQTLSAFERREDLRVTALILALATAQTTSYRALSNFSIYGSGWLARTARRQAAALAAAQQASSAAQLEATV
ncbi:glycosyl hydrolase 108 family protein [Lichenicoccus sp.]|uniref:glycosyl hydrolase 108 family protein n=1 Tax=Lichenicoccus sp. TaxID=2781899 RepID=UPI003D122875